MNEIRTTITYNLPILRIYMIFVRIYNLFGFPVKYESSYFLKKDYRRTWAISNKTSTYWTRNKA